jgi:hypothetical protein
MIKEGSLSIRVTYSINLRACAWDVGLETFSFQFTSIKFKG